MLMKVGLNTAVCASKIEAGSSQLECLKTWQEFPVTAVEVRGEYFNPATFTAEMTAIQQLAQTMHWQLFISIPAELFPDQGVNSHLQEVLTMATKYGIAGVKYSLGTPTSSALAAIKPVLAEFPTVKVTVENQPTAAGQLNAVQHALQTIKEERVPLGFTFDAGNWYWVGEDPVKAFDTLASSITMFHLKDIHNRETQMLGMGDCNWQPLIQKLSTTVPVFLEYAIAPKDVKAEIAKVTLLS